MNTKTLLIIFAILLLLLTLLSAFGGSIRPVAPEPFVSGHPFEKFFDPSTITVPEEDSQSANPLFQNQSSVQAGREGFNAPNASDSVLPPFPATSAPTMTAKSSETFIEPFENDDKLATLAPF
jgi:hypothetical protein